MDIEYVNRMVMKGYGLGLHVKGDDCSLQSGSMVSTDFGNGYIYYIQIDESVRIKEENRTLFTGKLVEKQAASCQFSSGHGYAWEPDDGSCHPLPEGEQDLVFASCYAIYHQILLVRAHVYFEKRSA